MKTIVAVDEKWGIGKANGLLFSIPEDMKRFRETTVGKVVVMGFNTLKSFPNSAPLKNRKMNIVLSDTALPETDGLTVCGNIPDLAKTLAKYDPDEVFIIGGGMMYRTFIDCCSEAYITKVAADGQATVFFPNLDEKDNWELVKTEEPIVSNGLTITFCTYKNKHPKELI